jgi:hypothetical protein
VHGVDGAAEPRALRHKLDDALAVTPQSQPPVCGVELVGDGMQVHHSRGGGLGSHDLAGFEQQVHCRDLKVRWLRFS